MKKQHEINLLCETNSHWITRLYKGARDYSPEKFRPWVFEQLNGLIPFDEGFWSLMVDFEDGQKEKLNDLDYHFYLSPKVELQTPLPLPLNASRRLKFSHDVRSVMLEKPPRHSIGHSFGLTRNVGKPAFSPTESQLVAFMVPNITQALHINLHYCCEKDPQTLDDIVVVSHSGQLVQASLGAIERLVSLHAVQSGGKNLVNMTRVQCLIEEKALKVKNVGGASSSGFVILKFNAEALVKYLTKRQRQICCLLAKGVEDKAIGLHLSISHRTVSNHLKKIYRRFDVSRWDEAMRLLREYEHELCS